MSATRSPLSLRNILLVDAVTCAAMGMALAIGSAAIGELTRLPPALLWYAGLALLPIAAFMGVVATRPAIPAVGVCLIVAGNILWVAASLALLGGGWIAPNALGIAFVLVQATAVTVLAALEYSAMRQGAFALRTD